jgi:hypothetical protein
MSLEYSFYSRFPDHKIGEYRRVENALLNLQRHMETLTFAKAKTDADLAELLIEFGAALEAAQQTLGEGYPRSADTVQELEFYPVPGARQAYYLLLYGAEFRRINARRVVSEYLSTLHPIFNEAKLWHDVKKHVEEYTDALRDAIRPVGLGDENNTLHNSNRSATDASDAKPRWNEVTRELWFGSHLLKKYKRNPAKNQIDVIEAFHRECWPRSVLDPFNDARKLNQTIRDLNMGLTVKAIRFTGTGTTDVAWEPMLP